MSVSVIIPTHKRPDKVVEAVKSSLHQPEVDQIVIVVDGDATQYTSFIAEWKDKPKLDIVTPGKRIYSAGARNLGIDNAKGEYILFVDDDIVLENGFVKRALLTMEEMKADAVGGSVLPPNECHSDVPFFNPNTLLLKANSKYGPVVVPFTTTITLWKRWIFDKNVRFPYYRVNGYREESDLCVQALLLGAKIVYDPRCVSRHDYHIPSGGQWSHGFLVWYIYSLINNWKFLKRHYDFLRRRFGLKHSATLTFLMTAFRGTSLFVPPQIKKALRNIRQ